MADDDVICLSSDDEVACPELPRKKTNINCAPLIAKIEATDNKKDTKLCHLKRKSPDDNERSISNAIKKTKVDNNIVEEISIESPITNEITKPSTTIGDHNNEPSIEVLEDKLENEIISINKIAVKKITDLLKSCNSKAKIAPVVNDDVQKQVISSNSRESNGKSAISLKLHNSKTTSQNREKLLNPVAKLDNGAAIKKNSSSKISKINHQLLDDNNETAANELINITQSHNEKSKSEEPRLAICAKPENILDIVQNPKNSEHKNDEHLDEKIDHQEKSNDCLEICANSVSPEVLILPRAETPEALSAASKKTEVEGVFSNSSNDALDSEEKILPTGTENSNDSFAQSVEKSGLPRVKNSQSLNNTPDDITTKTTESVKNIELEQSVSISETGDTKIQTKNYKPVSKKIKPIRLSETISMKSNQLNSSTDKTLNSMKNSAIDNSKESDVNIANKNAKVENDSLSKNNSDDNIVPKSGCSKISDEEQSSPLKRKSASSEIVEKVNKKSEDSSKFEPQPGCSKSPDEIIDEKPRLVEFDRKPVPVATEDTFSMFLSLCLQTDRSSDMEKIVAKLKRYYEQLNPAYATSQVFRDTLNEKRDLIMRKGKKVVYHYVQKLKDDMKAKKTISTPISKRRKEAAEDAAEQDEEKIGNGAEEEDTEEAQRVRHKIKRIEKAMKECQKMITKYEEAEVDFDDENNSNYIKLDRFKERMVQLYTQMCKYTHEHPDAGRAYLRPKHLRVTQIPSVDQAINSFINSKLSVNKYKLTKGKSFVDGLIFPDYVDILECVEKVNKEQNMKLDRRAMQTLAKKAFTQMGKHLQEARQNDYWDTFSLNLDDNVDPAASDADLMEKLECNRTIAQENERKVLEEFVRKQEERKVDGNDDSPSEVDDEDEDEDEAGNEDQRDNDTKSNCDVETDEEMSIDEDTDHESPKDNDEGSIKTKSKVPDVEDEECDVKDDTEHITRNNNVEASDSTADKDSTSPVFSSKDSSGKEPELIEVILDEVQAEDVERQDEEKLQQPLRIRSFAKPPDSWQCSQDGSEEKNKDNTTESETLEDSEVQEISVVSVLPGRGKIVKNLTTNIETITEKSPCPNPSINNNNDQNLRHITAGVKRPVQSTSSQVQNSGQKIVASSRGLQSVMMNATQVRPRMIVTTSTPLQRPQLQINPRMALQKSNQVQLVQLPNGKYVSATIGSRVPNGPQFLTAVANSTQIRPVQLLSGLNTSIIRSDIRSPPRNSTNFTRSVSATSTPVQRPNNYHQIKVKNPSNLSAAQISRVAVLRVNNGKFITSSSSSENSRISHQLEQNSFQQQQKVSNAAVTDKGGKPRINDNARTVQHQKTIITRSRRPGDQNRQTSEGGPKR